MQKIISLIFILSILCIKINAQTTVIDDGSFLYIQGSSIQRVHIHKDLCAVQKTADKVILTFSSNNTPFVFSWNVAQSTAYKGGLNQTYDYIVGLLNTISTSTPPPSPNAGDSLLSSKIDTLINYVKMTDTTQIDTSLINYIFQFDTTINRLDSILANIKNKPINDTTHTAILALIQDTLISKLSLLDKSDIDTSLSQVIQLNQIIDSLGKLINKEDTIHTSILNSIYSFMSRLDTTNIDTALINYIFQFDRQNDTLSAILNAIKSKEDTSNQSILNMIKQNLSDSLRTSVYVNNDSINVHVLNSVVDSTYYVLLDSIVKLLQKDTTKDTLKVLSFKPLTKDIAGTVDTLYNCKGLSFRANSTTTGTLILYYEDGETDSYDLTTEDLPTWDNSTFISFVGYDATGVVGKLRINAVGCSQVPDNGCAKVVPLLDCESSTPIPTCVGWASGSGVWSSISGCWNTGQ
jgi:hypothetical protein